MTTPHEPRSGTSTPRDTSYGTKASGWRSSWKRSSLGRSLARLERCCASPLELLARSRMAREWLAKTPASVRLSTDGWARFDAGRLPGTEDVLEHARHRLSELRPILDRVRAGRSGGRKITLDLFGDEYLARHPVLVDRVLGDAWLRPVVEYLDTVPFVARVTLAHSAHLSELDEPAYHQRFHFDNDDTRHVKLYLHVHDVREEHGPVAFLPAAASARVVAALAREGRSRAADTTYSDAEVFRHAARDELVTVTGPAGSGVFVDLSRCLHFGSRVHAGHERTVLVVEFLRFQRLHENASNQLAPPRPDHDRIRRMALTPPVRRPRGYFLPDLATELSPR